MPVTTYNPTAPSDLAADPALGPPGAYGTVPVIPPTSTNTSQSTTTSIPNLPNYDALASAASLIAQNQMAGQLNPQDLANAQEWAAQRGVATGTGFDSPNNMAAYQQFLGLSAQQLEQQGLTNYNALLAGAPRTTDTTGSQTIDNNVLAAIYAAAPNPYLAAQANLAAQRAGLASGAGAVGGVGGALGGVGAVPHPATAAAGGGVVPVAGGAGAGGAGAAGAGGAGGVPINPATGYYNLPTGNTIGGGPDTGVTPGSSGVPGAASVDEFMAQLGIDTSQMSDDDINTLAYLFGYTPQTGLGYQPTSSGSMYMGDVSGGPAAGGATPGYYAGANVPAWQQAGYPSEQAYNDAIDAYMFGGDMGGAGSYSAGPSGGNLGSLFGDWWSGGDNSGVVGSPGNESVVGLGGATYPIDYYGGYGSYGGSYGGYGGSY